MSGKLNTVTAAVNFVPFHLGTNTMYVPGKTTSIGTQVSHTITVNSAMSLINSLFDSMTGDSDIGTIAGDILKAYGDGGTYELPDMLDTGFEFIHDENIGMQINNSTVFPFLHLLKRDGDPITPQELCDTFAIRQVFPYNLRNPDAQDGLGVIYQGTTVIDSNDSAHMAS